MTSGAFTAEKTVCQPEYPVGPQGQPVIMGHDDKRNPFLAVQSLDQIVHRFARMSVQVSCGFIGKHHAWIQDQRTSDRHALLLSARKLTRPVLDTAGKPDIAEQCCRVPGCHVPVISPDQCRHHDILQRSELGKQMMELKYESDPLVSESGDVFRRQGIHVDIAKPDVP